MANLSNKQKQTLKIITSVLNVSDVTYDVSVTDYDDIIIKFPNNKSHGTAVIGITKMPEDKIQVVYLFSHSISSEPEYLYKDVSYPGDSEYNIADKTREFAKKLGMIDRALMEITHYTNKITEICYYAGFKPEMFLSESTLTPR